MKNAVIGALTTLGQSAAARRDFARDPEAFAASFGLSKAAAGALRDGSASEIYRVAGLGEEFAPKLVLVPAANIAAAAA